MGVDSIPRRRIEGGLAYLLAVVLPVVSLLLRLALSSRFGDDPALELFLLPIILSAYAGGLGPGLVCTALVALTTDYFLLPPKHSFSIQSSLQSIEWLVLIIAGTLISVLVRKNRFSSGGALKDSAPSEKSAIDNGQRADLARTVVICAGSICAALGAVTLIGWFFHVPVLTRLGPSYLPMVANVALGMFLDGLALLFMVAGRPKAALPGAVWSLLAGALTLSEYAFSIDLHVDELLVRDYVRAWSFAAGRPAPNAALCLVLCGLALLWATIARWPDKGAAFIGGLGAVVFALGASAVYGYLTGLPMYAWAGVRPMVPNASAGFVVLGLGVMALAAGWQSSPMVVHGSLQSAEWKVRGGLTFGLACLMVIGSTSYLSFMRMHEERLWVDHTYQVIACLRLVPSSFLDAQAAIRGFIITGDEEFVGRMQAALREADAQMRNLRSLTADNRLQQVRLDMLSAIIAERLLLMQEATELRRRKGFAAAQKVVASRKGEQFHQRIVNAVAEMEATEQNLLRERTARAHKTAAFARTTILTGLTLAFGFVAVALFMIGRDFSGSRRAQAALQEAHDLLETRVRERTVELWKATANALEGEMRLNGIINSAMDAIITVDEQQTIVLFNPAAEKMFGHAAAEVVGQPLEVCIPERFRRSHEQHHRAFYDTGISQRQMGDLGTVFGLRANGEEFPIEASISRVGPGGRNLLTAILRDVAERVQTEADLHRQAELFDQAYDATFVWDWGGAITFWNRGAERLYGYSRAEAVGKVSQQLLHTRTVDTYVPFAVPLKEDGQWEGELEHLTRDGRRMTVDSRMALVRDRQHWYVLETTRDITSRKRAESALQESEERLRLFVEYAPAALAMFDHEMRYLQVSRRWLADYGLGNRDVRGLSHYELFPEIPARWREVHRRGLAGEVLREESDRFERADGDARWIRWEVRPWHETKGDIGGIVIFTEDITEHKRAEEALRENHARLKKVLEVETVGVMFWDLTSGRLVEANDTFLNLMGYSRSDVETCELTWQKFTPPEYLEVSRAELRKFAASGRVGPYEKEYFRKDGTRQWLLFAGSSLGGNSCVEFCVDISDRKAAEQEIRRLNADLERRVEQRTAELQAANKELESFSYSVAHDLRAPLRAVDGFSNALLEDYGPQLPAEAKKYLDTIRTGAQRMGWLIDDLLAFSRLNRQGMTRQHVDMEMLVRSALEDVVPEGKQANIEIVNGNLPSAQGDPSLLRQVWANLLSNAIKYSRHAQQARIEIGSLAEGNKNVYYVRDNGAGFDMKYADKLFGVFQRLHRQEEFEGTGIGLAIVQRVIHRHGGRVWAEAKVNEGATFYFTLESELSHG